MTSRNNPATADLFAGVCAANYVQPIGEAAAVLRGFAAAEQVDLVTQVHEITCLTPLRHMVTPGGQRMSVAMTNCGAAGWVSDRRGYRYDEIDPLTQRRWPPMPECFLDLAARAAQACGFDRFAPDACLINRYQPGTRLTLHQDRNERDFAQPIVSVSLGLPATFLFGALTRAARPARIVLLNADVAVWGGPARLRYHGVAPLADGDHPLTGRCRLNLTFRKAL